MSASMNQNQSPSARFAAYCKACVFPVQPAGNRSIVNTRIRRSRVVERFGDLARSVGAAVVHHDDLEVRVILGRQRIEGIAPGCPLRFAPAESPRLTADPAARTAVIPATDFRVGAAQPRARSCGSARSAMIAA